MATKALSVAVAERDEAVTEAWWIFPTIPLLSAAVSFAWILHGNLQRLYGMTASAWDMAHSQQVIWNVSTGQGFYTSFQRTNFLGIHFELIFFVIAAVEKLWPNPAVLLIFAAAGLASAAPAAYLFFRAMLPADREGSPWLAVALSAPIPFWAATQEAARDFFHPENLALTFALLAAWAGIRGRRIAMWSFCVLTLTCKEDQVYTVGVVGLLMSAYGAPEVKKHWRFIVYLASAWFLIGPGIVQSMIRRGGYSDFSYYSWLIGLDPSHLVSGEAILAAVFRPEALLMVAGITASLFLLPLLAPRWLLLAIPPYIADVLSGHNPEYFLRLHYVLLLLFPMIVAGAVGARKFLERRSLQPATALAAALAVLLLGWGSGRFPPAIGADLSLYSRPNTVADLAKATSRIPADAPVSADNGLVVWLANRHTINDFPSYLDSRCYVVIDYQPYFSGPVSRTERQAALEALPGSGRRLLYDNGRFQVWSPIGD
jgi:uncharacterized membrane protein